MSERWLPIPNFMYEVSDAGAVRRAGAAQTLALKPHRNGYVRVTLSSDGVPCDRYVHRLVCEAFLGAPPTPDHHADHINGRRADNRLQNLRWLTAEENRALRQNRRGATHHASKLSSDTVREIRATPRSQKTDKQLALELGVSRETVRDARTGKLWRHVDG